jgi:Uma2 family endonuclease
MRPQEHLNLTADQYLAQERSAEFKSEFINGEIFAMAGASREHNQISSNIVASLSVQLQDKPCSAYSSDMKVKIDRANKYTYPDIVTACDPQRFEDEHSDVLLNPTVIMEILSDSTEAYDRGLKFFHYQRLDSLREYLLISQKSCHVEKYERQAENQWVYSEFHQLEDAVNIHTLNCILSLKDIYRKLELKEAII